MSWKLRNKPFPVTKAKPLSSWQAFGSYVDNPEFTPDLDVAWELWKKRAWLFLITTLALVALSIFCFFFINTDRYLVRFSIYVFGATVMALISLPFLTLLEWANTKDKIKKWHKENTAEDETLNPEATHEA